MPQFSSKRRVHHSAPQMFELVADVERYPEFVPLCRSLKIRQRTPKPDGTEIVIADMTVSFKLVREAFTSRVTLDRPNLKILVEYLQGPFSNLENRFQNISRQMTHSVLNVGARCEAIKLICRNHWFIYKGGPMTLSNSMLKL